MSYNLKIKETLIKFLIFSILVYLISVVVTPSASPDAAEVFPPYLLIETSELEQQVLDAGKTIELTIPIKNTGIGDAIDVILELHLKGGLEDLAGLLSFPASTDVPDIPKGGETKVPIKISGSYKLPNAKGKIEVSLSDPAFDQTFPGDPISLETRKLVVAKLSLKDFDAAPVEAESTSSNNRIHIHQTIELTFKVKNESKVSAENVEVKVENEQDGVIWLPLEPKTEPKTEISISKLDPNKFEKVTFRCHTNDEFKDNKLIFKIKALFKSKADEDEPLGFDKTKKVSIKRGPPGRDSLIWPFIVTICLILIIGIFFGIYLKKIRTQRVVIQDKALRDLLRGKLQLEWVAPITKNQLKKLDKLEIHGADFGPKVLNLAGIEKAVNLKSLKCRGIDDITPLAKLKQLETLNLYSSKISDIRPLAKLKQLEVLALDDNQISDIRPLAKLKQLEVLALKDNQISDIKPLAKLKKVQKLFLNNNEINDISVLEQFERLELLHISGNPIIDVEAIRQLRAQFPKLKVDTNG